MKVEPDPAAVANLLTLRYNPLQKSLVPKLVADDFIQKENDEPEGTLMDMLERVIKRSLEGCKNVTIALSSGMDSALMLAVTRKVFPEIKIEGICVTFDDMYDETEQAASTASRFDANLHVVSVDNVLSDLPEQINIAGEPRWNLYWCHVVKNAGKFSKMLLTGDGGDELFGGYTFRYKKFLDSIAPSDTSMDRARKYLECHERDWVPDQHLLFGPRIKFSWNGVMELLKPYFDNKLDGIAQVFLADYNGKLLFDWMPVNKKFYEHFSVMGVAPMLNPEVIRFATHLPYNIKYDRENNSGKIIIQNILANKFNFKVSNDKKGFSVDTLQLWRRHGMEISHKYLHDAKIVRDGWISEGWIKKSFELLKERLDVRYVNKMLSLLAFEIWYRIFVTGEMSPKSKI